MRPRPQAVNQINSMTVEQKQSFEKFLDQPNRQDSHRLFSWILKNEWDPKAVRTHFDWSTGQLAGRLMTMREFIRRFFTDHIEERGKQKLARKLGFADVQYLQQLVEHLALHSGEVCVHEIDSLKPRLTKVWVPPRIKVYSTIERKYEISIACAYCFKPMPKTEQLLAERINDKAQVQS